jgi:hypothetical protein
VSHSSARLESDRDSTIVAAADDPEALARWPLGMRSPVEGNSIATLVRRSDRSVRIDSYDKVAGPIAARCARSRSTPGGQPRGRMMNSAEQIAPRGNVRCPAHHLGRRVV